MDFQRFLYKDFQRYLIKVIAIFVSLTKEIVFVLNIKGDTPTVMCSLFENSVTGHEDNQGAIALVVALQMTKSGYSRSSF